MKIAVLADIHANLAALEKVAAHVEAWRPDEVVVAGDVVNRGPQPVACWQFVQAKQRRKGWRVLIGNHEEYVISQAQPDAPLSGPQLEMQQFTRWTYERMGCNVTPLEALPLVYSRSAPDGSELRVTHASMRSTRDGIFPETSDAQLRQQIEPAPTMFCVGHTHRPLIRRIDETLVVNVGAVGLPFDRDHRASYAQLTWQQSEGWQAEIVRLAYNRERTERMFYESGFMAAGGPLTNLIMIEFQEAKSQIFQWTAAFEAAVLAGELSVAASVRQFIANDA